MFQSISQLDIKRRQSFSFILTPRVGVGIELASFDARINLTPCYGVETGLVDNDRVTNNYKPKIV